MPKILPANPNGGRTARMREAGKIAEAVRRAATIPAAAEANAHVQIPEVTPAIDADHPHAESFDLLLLANFIHQVVNPLNGVAGILDNLVEGKVQGPGRGKQRLTAARAQLEQCISLVRNLAFFAQGFSTLQPTERRAVVVPQVIIEAAQVFQEQAANKKMTIFLVNRQDQNKIL